MTAVRGAEQAMHSEVQQQQQQQQGEEEGAVGLLRPQDMAMLRELCGVQLPPPPGAAEAAALRRCAAIPTRGAQVPDTAQKIGTGARLAHTQ
jgi:hypothetical protein